MDGLRLLIKLQLRLIVRYALRSYKSPVHIERAEERNIEEKKKKKMYIDGGI